MANLALLESLSSTDPYVLNRSLLAIERGMRLDPGGALLHFVGFHGPAFGLFDRKSPYYYQVAQHFGHQDPGIRELAGIVLWGIRQNRLGLIQGFRMKVKSVTPKDFIHLLTAELECDADQFESVGISIYTVDDSGSPSEFIKKIVEPMSKRLRRSRG